MTGVEIAAPSWAVSGVRDHWWQRYEHFVIVIGFADGLALHTRML
jgi:hypothetical protein